MIERSFEDDVRHRSELWRAAGADGSFRASVPPIKILEFARRAALDDWSADAGFGVVVGFTSPARWDAIRGAAHALGGSVHFVEGGRTRVQLEAGRRALLLRLKDAFDPDGKLEPFPEP